MKGPVLIIIVGPNGAGKSTLHASLPEYKVLPFVNADLIARARFEEIGEAESVAAQKEAQAQINLYFQDQESFCYETVFSHDRFRIFDTSHGHATEVARTDGVKGYTTLATIPGWAQEILAGLAPRSGA